MISIPQNSNGQTTSANSAPVVLSAEQENILLNIALKGSPSVTNNTIINLNDGQTFTGIGELNDFPDVLVVCKASHSGILYFDFSVDNTNWETFPSTGFTVSAGIQEAHKAIKGSRYFRVRFLNNSGNTLTYIRLYSYYGNFDQLNSPLTTAPSTDSDSIVTKSVIIGQTDGGSFEFVPVTPEGHIEVALHEPLLPFGSMHTEKLTPVYQGDAVYGLNDGLQRYGTSGSASINTDEGSFDLATGTTVGSLAVVQSLKRIKYRAGQGVVNRFTVEASTGDVGALQYGGITNGEDSVYIANKDNVFGVVYQRRGKREIRTLTITTASSTTQNVTVTLNGVAVLVAVTNSGNIQRTVWELSRVVYPNWRAFPKGNTVVFISDSSGDYNGSYSISGTTVVGSFARTRAGLAVTETFYPKTEWNGDVFDGTGKSGITIDTTKKNIFEISYGYLGTDNIVIKTKQTPVNGNNSTWYTAHTIRLTNSLTEGSFRNPTFAFTAAVISITSATNVTLSVTSYSAFIEGEKMLHGNRVSILGTPASIGTSITPLFTVYQPREFNGRSSQIVSNLISISASYKHTSGGIFYLIKNAELTGNPNFTQWQTNSPLLVDSSATGVTVSSNDQIVWTAPLAETTQIDHHFTNGTYNAEEMTLQVGEWITLACKTDSGTSTTVKGTLNFRDDI